MADEGRVYCEHCGIWVSKRTEREHRRLAQDLVDDLQSESETELDFSIDQLVEDGELHSKRMRLDTGRGSEHEDLSDMYVETEFLKKDMPRTRDGSESMSDDSDMFGIGLSSSSESEESDDAPEIEDSDDEDDATEPNCGVVTGAASIVVKLFIIFLVSWKAMCCISDTAMGILLKFIAQSFKFTAAVINSEKLKYIAAAFPQTLYKLRGMIGSHRNDFEQYVVCPKCDSIYKPENMLQNNSRGVITAKKCSHVQFPNHPHINQRQPCGASLFKKVRTSSGTLALKPKHIYCFRSIKSALSMFLNRPDFADKCEEWKNRDPDPDILSDVYDGDIWKNFKGSDGEWFFENPFSYGCSINLDWFQPYEKTQYSVGVLYLCILNLPPEERYKEENVAIIGIIPGPHEPSKHVNSFLDPAVKDLLELYNGSWIEIENTGELRFCHLAVLCATCDIPASRKLAGFVSFGGLKGCNKCLKEFSCKSFGEKSDYSGFDKNSWGLRDPQQHREKAFQHKSAPTKAERKRIERGSGVRYSCLCELPYFNSIRFVVIDPMHNLLLGTTKRMLKIWKKDGLLQDKDFKKLQQRVNEMATPAGIGRVPLKIASGFSGFTADQFKNWNLVFSCYALKGVLPEEHLQAWKIFVKACSLICRRNITASDCRVADQLLLHFCKSVERLYGKKQITMNMHLHCHLCECILDFGPVYSFWCFGFERFNGILGSYHVNNHHIEVQLMRRFLENQQIRVIDWPEEIVQFKTLLTPTSQLKGSLATATRVNRYEFSHSVRQTEQTGADLRDVCFTSCRLYLPLGRIKAKYLCDEEVHDILKMYQQLHDPDAINLVPQYYEEFYQLLNCGELYGSNKSRNDRSSTVLARWHGRWGLDMEASERRPGEIQHFLRHTLMLNNETETVSVTYILAYVRWFKPHPHCRQYFGLPTQVCLQHYEPPSSASFIPVGRISHRCAAAKVKYNLRTVNGTEQVVIVMPLERQFNM